MWRSLHFVPATSTVGDVLISRRKGGPVHAADRSRRIKSWSGYLRQSVPKVAPATDPFSNLPFLPGPEATAQQPADGACPSELCCVFFVAVVAPQQGHGRTQEKWGLVGIKRAVAFFPHVSNARDIFAAAANLLRATLSQPLLKTKPIGRTFLATGKDDKAIVATQMQVTYKPHASLHQRNALHFRRYASFQRTIYGVGLVPNGALELCRKAH